MAERRFVHFLHPGGEHSPDTDGFINWNRSKHKRKFLRQTGRCISELGDTTPWEGELDFWGEWEPESQTVARFKQPSNGQPKFVFAPFYQTRRDYAGLCNTDPCVFGGFFYCVCQQRGVMKRLGRGSVILFGSCKSERFVLDTDFVVAGVEKYHRRNFRKLSVPEAYRHVGLCPLFATRDRCGRECRSDEREESFQLYRGATFENRVNGMFSFFPCHQSNDRAGFARPSIKLPSFISDNQRQGYKRSDPLDTADQRNLWERTVAQVIEQGLSLGVFAKTPTQSIPEGN